MCACLLVGILRQANRRIEGSFTSAQQLTEYLLASI